MSNRRYPNLHERLMDVLVDPTKEQKDRWRIPRGIAVAKHRRRRSILEYYYELLLFLEERGQTSRYRLMQLVENNNAHQFAGMIDPLIENKYIEITNPMVKTRFYVITEKGREFLSHIKDLKPYLLELEPDSSIISKT